MFVDERAIIVQLPWALWSQRTRAGAHVTCRLADGNLEPILDYSQIYSASRGGAWDGRFFFSG